MESEEVKRGQERGGERGREVSDQQDGIIIIRSRVLEGDPVPLHVREVLLGLLGRAGAQTLVVLDLPRVGILCGTLPVLELREGEEGMLLLAFGHL